LSRFIKKLGYIKIDFHLLCHFTSFFNFLIERNGIGYVSTSPTMSPLKNLVKTHSNLIVTQLWHSVEVSEKKPENVIHALWATNKKTIHFFPKSFKTKHIYFFCGKLVYKRYKIKRVTYIKEWVIQNFYLFSPILLSSVVPNTILVDSSLTCNVNTIFSKNWIYELGAGWSLNCCFEVIFSSALLLTFQLDGFFTAWTACSFCTDFVFSTVYNEQGKALLYQSHFGHSLICPVCNSYQSYWIFSHV
jgi:hypothetical protein